MTTSAVKYRNFVAVIEVVNGNPNGDPLAGNEPRKFDNGIGFITSHSIKSKIREFISNTTSEADKDHLDIFIERDCVLNKKIKEAKDKSAKDAILSDVLAEKYWDLRAFGGVVSTGDNKKGKPITGAITMYDATSVQPIHIKTVQISRSCATDDKEASAEGDEKKKQTLGMRFAVSHEVYIIRGEINALQAVKNKLTEEDVQLFFNGLLNAFQISNTTNREIVLHNLFVFEHKEAETGLNLAQVNRLNLEKCISVKANTEYPASFEDYTVSVDFKDEYQDKVSLTDLA